MAELTAELAARLVALASDRESGASDLLANAVDIFRDARAAGVDTLVLARAVVRAQPSMAPLWNAAVEAVAADSDPPRFERFAQRVARSAEAMARFAATCFGDDDGAGPLRLVTISRSRSVEVVFDAIRQRRPIRVSCSESRPALEGRRLAARLAASGVQVSLFSDAAIGHALAAADAVVLGADAVGPEWFINKSGSGMLAAAAAQRGVPVYIAATRDKFVGEAVGERLRIREGAPAEIWEAPPAGVDLRNPYFESTPLDVITSVISDFGVLGIGMVPDVCRSIHDAQALQALRDIGG